jgi:hypothetical protein
MKTYPEEPEDGAYCVQRRKGGSWEDSPGWLLPSDDYARAFQLVSLGQHDYAGGKWRILQQRKGKAQEIYQTGSEPEPEPSWYMRLLAGLVWFAAGAEPEPSWYVRLLAGLVWFAAGAALYWILH